ncbi:TPA: hypothetical protein N0F65_006286 [Lagenidium giganteum]|uniref:WRKY19-like zinc finger domain-containing protein n=1 Tax=Lagenidium giganteum TaxID=4803 RepID=A0AAV2YFW9_9STRA|nr:TPA: hypothetical protein N0F65_006286 [Lagenidium giganteum]
MFSQRLQQHSCQQAPLSWARWRSSLWSAGCNKCAQSRSSFCWAHGGGKRCELVGCMRSRKSKRFCVDHLLLEDESSISISDTKASADTRRGQTRNDGALGIRVPPLSSRSTLLPSLKVALQRVRSEGNISAVHDVAFPYHTALAFPCAGP